VWFCEGTGVSMAVVIGLDGCKGECKWCCEGSGVRMVARVSVSG
jgi:hypothetical protein